MIAAIRITVRMATATRPPRPMTFPLSPSATTRVRIMRPSSLAVSVTRTASGSSTMLLRDVFDKFLHIRVPTAGARHSAYSCVVIPCRFSSFATASLGCAPLLNHSRALSPLRWREGWISARIIVPDDVHKRPVTRSPLVCYNYAVMRLLPKSFASQSNTKHLVCHLFRRITAVDERRASCHTSIL